ncbi:MAG: Gfo/Idh/MocA family oxidoreductase, partial [Chthoniobacterales bacterium]|nr:Gfo/Idh/MocA family oxidoreductase [Chthoniobacterales bacterium]
MSKLRIGFIGAGGNTLARHIPGFLSVKNVELVAVANRSIESALKVSLEWNFQRAEEKWENIIQSSEIDIVCIGTWPSTHAQMTVAALKAGKHVLCEARMAANFVQAGQMLAASTANPHLAAWLVPAPFTLAHDQVARNILSSGQLGKPQKVIVDQRNSMFLDRSGPPPWRLLSQHSGVNILTLGIYYEILQRWLGTEATPTHAYAFRRSIPADHPWRDVDLPEFLQVAAVYPALDNCPLEMHLSSIHEETPTNYISIQCEAGTLFWDGST